MIHEILPVGPLQCNCSVIGDETTRDAMVIDPGDDIEDVLALIQKHNLQGKADRHHPCPHRSCGRSDEAAGGHRRADPAQPE